MEAAYTLPSPNDAPALPPKRQSEERRCLVTGEMLPKTELIRFVVGPDDVLFPDLAHNLPGRGLWVKADREHITAATKGLFAKAAKAKVKTSPDLADQVAQLIRKRCLDFLGLAKRSGIAVLGQPQVETAIRARTLKLMLIASDASEKGVSEIMHMPLLGEMPVLRTFTRAEMGPALGYEQVVYVGLQPHALTKKFHAEMTRLDKIAGTAHFTENKG